MCLCLCMCLLVLRFKHVVFVCVYKCTYIYKCVLHTLRTHLMHHMTQPVAACRNWLLARHGKMDWRKLMSDQSRFVCVCVSVCVCVVCVCVTIYHVSHQLYCSDCTCNLAVICCSDSLKPTKAD